MLTLGSKEFYRKWIRDILDCQDPESGHIQHTAPFMGGGGGPGGRGRLSSSFRTGTGKISETQTFSANACPLSESQHDLVSRSENHLVVREEEGGWCLGDWCTLEKCRIPEPLVNTWYLVKQLGMLGEICGALGEPFDEKYETLRSDALEALRLTYFSGDTPDNRGRASRSSARRSVLPTRTTAQNTMTGSVILTPDSSAPTYSASCFSAPGTARPSTGSSKTTAQAGISS